tara:strand:+ start:120 stop:356 length:237 start_codon:yes stop_codon:yes gene_type:complete
MLGKKVFDSNLSEVVLFADAVEMWQTDHLPNLPRSFDGSLDEPAAAEDWSYFVDHLHRDGQISDWQNHNWGVPPCLED